MDSLLEPIDLSDSANNAVTNLTDSVTKNVGQTFGDIWYLVFGGISHAADKKRMKYSADLKIYEQELTQSINSIPADKYIEPSIQVTAQALENSKYCVESEVLRNMFVNLISGTMNKDYAGNTHPSFPEILKQMSPTDAYVIKEFQFSSRKPIVNYKIKQSKGGFIPYKNYVYLGNNPFSSSEYAASISSLQRLGLITVRFDEYFTDERMYEPFKDTKDFHSLESEAKAPPYSGSPELEKGLCELTPLGKNFVNVCVPLPTISLQIL